MTYHIKLLDSAIKTLKRLDKKEGQMIAQKLQTKMGKNGCPEIRNLPLGKGTVMQVPVLPKKQGNIDKLLQNSYVWTEEDVKSVEKGREIINQWKIF